MKSYTRRLQTKGRIEVVASQADSGQLKIDVKDSGVGIPAAELDQLFQKYRQATNIKSSKEKRTGLGLMICKMIVDAHNGQITVENKEGKGTTFAIFCHFNPTLDLGPR